MIENFDTLKDCYTIHHHYYNGGAEAFDRLPEDIGAIMREKGYISPADVSPALIKRMFIAFGKDTEPRFEADDNTLRVIELLTTWIIERPTSGPVPKGIILMGKVGSGKTTLVKTLSDVCRWFASANDGTFQLSYVPSYKVVDAYNKHGAEAFDNVTKVGSQHITFSDSSLIIDDLGAETLGSHYGKTENVIESLILRRYDNKALTLATTNLSQSAIREFYGPRAWSRMVEMFTFIELKGNDRRK